MLEDPKALNCDYLSCSRISSILKSTAYSLVVDFYSTEKSYFSTVSRAVSIFCFCTCSVGADEEVVVDPDYDEASTMEAASVGSYGSYGVESDVEYFIIASNRPK